MLIRAVVSVVFAALVQQVSSQVDTSALSRASNHFSNSLFEKLAKKPGNVLVCPLSAHVALAVLNEGAGGQTKRELTSVLGLDGNTDIKPSYQALLSGLNDNTLKVVTKLFPAEGWRLNRAFINDAKQYYLSDVESISYENPNSAASTINSYVEEKTNKKISFLISPASLSSSTRLVVINAVYFQVKWKKTFKGGYESDFKVSQSEKIKTRFMSQTNYFQFKEDFDLDAKVLKMDYTEDDYSMLFILPNKEDGLPEVEERLARTDLPDLLRGLSEHKVDVTIPKFTLEMTINLKNVLQKMGVTSIFSSSADLKGISSYTSLYVTDAVQKTYINVHENGTEAAAATGFLETLSAIPNTRVFSARTPFHFYLMKNKGPGVVMFQGRLQRPDSLEPADDPAPVAQKVEGEEPWSIPGGSPRPQYEQNQQGAANGNRKPGSGLSGERVPPRITYTEDIDFNRQQVQVLPTDRFAPAPAPAATATQPGTTRPLTYAEYWAAQAQSGVRRRQHDSA